jgi:hypothetical protein
MVPVSAPSGELLLRRGTMEVPTASGLINLTARGAILEPGHPFFVSDRVVARSGVLVDRYIRRTRAANGGTLVWMARSATTGRGPGWSGLRFDLVRGTASA